jgi:hypothetical protein
VWTFIVELLDEHVELALLTLERVGGRSCGLVLQCSMHTLMTTVLLRFAGLDEIGQHAELNPPGRQARQSRKRVSGERRTIVATDESGETEFPKDASKIQALRRLVPSTVAPDRPADIDCTDRSPSAGSSTRRCRA